MRNILLKINSVDVTSYLIKEELENTHTENTDMIKFSLKLSVRDDLTISKFQTIEVWEAISGTLETDANRTFRGFVTKTKKDAGVIEITGFCKMWRAIQTEINKTYDKNIDPSAGQGSEIFKALCDEADLNYTSSTIQSTSGIVLEKFVCDKTDVMERMQTLAEIYGYQFYYNPTDDNVYFEPEGYETNSNVLYVGGTNNNLFAFPEWKEDSSEYANKVEVIGATQSVEQTETFSGDGSETEFELSFVPENVRVVVGGTEQIGGVVGSTETYDYYVDKSNKKIVFVSGSIPASGTDNISVEYSTLRPRPVVRRNESAISEIGFEVKRRFTFGDIQSVDDAESRAENLVRIYSQSFISTKIKLSYSNYSNFGIKVGQTIRVIDSRQEIDRFVLIRKVRSQYPKNEVELEVGDKEARISGFEYDTTMRIKRLEEEKAKSGTFIVQVIDENHTIQTSRRYLKTQKRSITGQTGIYGNSIFGIYGTSKYGSSATTSFILGSSKAGVLGTSTLGEVASEWQTNFIQQGNNIYQEDFYDDDFKSTNTTADWNTDLDFTADQIAESTSIDYNNQTITSAKFEITSSSGTFKLEATADGTNWEEVDSFTGNLTITHNFSNTGTDLRWRLTEINSSTGKVVRVKIYNYH